MLAQLAVKNLAPKLRNENDVVFALPFRVTSALKLVHRDLTLRVLGGSHREKSRWTSENVKLLLPPRQSRGNSQRINAVLTRCAHVAANSGNATVSSLSEPHSAPSASTAGAGLRRVKRSILTLAKIGRASCR